MARISSFWLAAGHNPSFAHDWNHRREHILRYRAADDAPSLDPNESIPMARWLRMHPTQQQAVINRYAKRGKP